MSHTPTTASEASVLVIGGDSSLFEALSAIGRQYGFATQHAPEGAEGLQMAEKDEMDVIVLDLNTRDMTGFDVCRRLRHAGVEVPVLMLSDSGDPIDVVVGLEIGADDFIVKPFELRELAARVQAKLRRQRSSRSQVRPGKLRFPGLTVDIGRHEVLRDGHPVTLTPTEFDLLALLSACPGKVISRSDMIEKVWGRDADLDLRSVDAHVYRLRRKIEPEGGRPTYIHAVPGVGYRFERRGLTDRLARSSDDATEPSRNGMTEQRVAAR